MFTVPLGNGPVATDSGGGGLMVMLSAWVTLLLAESVTCTVNLEVSKSVGVPVIWAEELVLVVWKVNPAGRLPAVMAQVKVPVAPVALTNALYGMPKDPAGREVVVMVSTAFSVIDSVAVMLLFATDVAVMVAVVFVEIVLGAVYTTDVVVLLLSVPGPVRVQVTP